MAEIILNPYNSLGESAFDTGSLLHQEEFDRVIKKVDIAKEVVDKLKHPNEYKNRLEEDNFGYYYNTITILGSRGSGKTSFLLSLMKRFRKDKDIHVMDLIDPTKIEEKGHVFLTILSLLDKEVKRHLTECSNNPENKNFRYKQEWTDIMKSMAAGLPYLDGIGHGCQDWQDEEFIMDNGLKCVGSAINLKTDFERLVKLALQIIGDKKLIVITFDDIDTDFRKGWLVLETLRKYLNIPQIVTFVSGDRKLLSKGIRKHQWKSFGKALVINEGEHLKRMSVYDDMVSEMESQYIQKVLPTQNWVVLSTIQDMILNDSISLEDIKVIIDEEGNTKSIVDFYLNKLSLFGICNGYQATSYIKYLLTLPLRTQLQIIIAFQDTNRWSILNPFVGSLMVKNIDADLLKSNEWRTVKSMLSLLIDEKCLDEAYQILPTMVDNQINDCNFALGTMFSLYVKDYPHLIFDYWLSIGHTRNLLTLIPLTGENNANIADMCSFVDIGLDNIYRNICCKKEAYIRAALNSKQSKTKEYTKNWGGTIVLSGLASRQKKNTILLYDRIDSVFKNKPFSTRCIAYMPLMLAEYSRKQQVVPLYSINVLLASIGELLRYSNDKNISIKQLISSCSQIRSFVMPEFGDRNENESIEGSDYNEEYDISAQDDDSLDKLVSDIEKWAGSIKELHVPPYLVGKISTRIFYAYRAIDNIDGEKVGDAMHRRIIILMNAVLIEEAKELFPKTLVNNNNPITRDNIFVNNIKVLYRQRKSLPLTQMFMTCPLLTAFLNLKNELATSYTDFVDKAKISTVSVYDDLKSVSI